jgi:hypothetical protein
MPLKRILRQAGGRCRIVIPLARARLADLGIAAVIVLPALGQAASAGGAPTMLYGTLDTEAGTAATESDSGVGMAMFEFDWAGFEPEPGTFNSSYLASMKADLAAYQAAGMDITLGLGLQDPPAWVLKLADASYVDQNRDVSTEADFVFSAAVRAAADTYLAQIAASVPLSEFWAIRLTSGGDDEMIYPGKGTYWAFNSSALTGNGLPAGLTPNPYPSWTPGTPGLTQDEIKQWVTWYVGGLDNVTDWQMQKLNELGFTGYYETVTPGSGTRPDVLAEQEEENLPDGTTGVGAVWNVYYANLEYKSRVIAYVSSVADESGDNDTCQPSDDSLPLSSPVMDSWSATRWIARIANQYGMLVGGENPGYHEPASLDTFYTDAAATGEMAAALAQARACGFTVFYWAHDTNLWRGVVPFTTYAAMIG